MATEGIQEVVPIMSAWPTARGMELVKYQKMDLGFLLCVELELKRSLLSRLFGSKPGTIAIAFRGEGTVWHYYPSGKRAPTSIEKELFSFCTWVKNQGKDFDSKYVPGFPTIERSEVPPPPARKRS